MCFSNYTLNVYAPNGNMLTVTDGNFHTSETEYDGLNRAFKHIDAAGGVTLIGQGDRFTVLQKPLRLS